MTTPDPRERGVAGSTLFPRRVSCAVLSAAAGLSATLAVSPAHAVDLEWTNPDPVGLLVFNTDTNWDPVNTPDLGDNVLFQINNGGNTILMNAGAEVNNLTVANNLWVFSGLTGGDLTTADFALIDDPTGTTLGNGTLLQIIDGMSWNISDPLTTVGDDNPLIVGSVGTGSLLINGGSTVAAEIIRVGNQSGGTGEITLNGTGTTLTGTYNDNWGIITLGYDGGTGTINVQAGAQLLTSSVSGNDIWVGGHLDDAVAGTATTSTGTLNVNGAGAFVETEDLNVGIAGGVGFLNITNGGQVILTDGGTNGSPDAQFGANDGFNGAKSTGTGVVDGNDSLLQGRSIFVGGSGTGTLDIRNGAVARTQTQGTTVGDAILGINAGSDGKMAVHGSGTNASLFDVDNSLIVGDAGLGFLNIGRDLNDNEVGFGQLQVDVDLFIADEIGNNGDNTVVVSGMNATANIGRDLSVGNEGKGIFEARNGATITVGDEVHVGLANGADGTVLLDGGTTTLTAAFLFAGNGTGVGTTANVTVQNGATATFTGAGAGTGVTAAVNTITLGDDDEGVGTLTVTGNNSLVETTNATGGWFIGGSGNENGGTGTANILDGGRGISASRVIIGHDANANGTLTVSGANSQFDANGDLILVGYIGTGNLDVTDGGTVNANGVFVADALGSFNSQLDVDGPGSVLNIATRLLVGDSDRGFANVTNGGRINVATNGGGSSADRLVIGNGAAADASVLTIDGPGSRVDYFGTERVSVGLSGGSNGDRARLIVSNGGVLQAVQRDGSNNILTQGFLIVGDESGGNGQIDVTGAGSRVEARYLNLGEQTNASGIVNIRDGGNITITEFAEVGAAGDADNIMTVEGAGSTFNVGGDLSVAAGASNLRVDGQLIIRDGGTVTNGGLGYIGRASTNVGRVDLGGPGALATWDVGNDFIMSGSTNHASSAGSQSSGSSELNLLENGRLNVAGNFYLKDRGTINLNGGELIANDLIFLDFGGASYTPVPTLNYNAGLLRFTDPAGKTLDTAALSNLFNGNPAVLDAGKHLAVDGEAFLTAPLRVNGGTLSLGSITAADFANVDFDAGTLNFTNSGVVVTPAGIFGNTLTVDDNQAITISNGLFVTATGVVSVARGSVAAATGANSGTFVIAEGDATFDVALVNNPDGDLILIDADVTGTLDNFGDLTVVNTSAVSNLNLRSEGTLALGIETTAGTADLLDVAGTATVAGNLAVTTDDPLALTVGSVYELITAGTGVTGTFDTLDLPALAAGLGFDVLYETNRVALEVVSLGAVFGDYNDSGQVEQADLDFVLQNWGDTDVSDVTAWTNFAGLPGGDIDGQVEQTELDLVLTNWGDTTAPDFTGSTVPEPAAALWLFTSLALRRRPRN